MRVSIVRGGGVGGLVSRTVLDAEALPPPETAKLDELVEGAAVRAGPSEHGGARHSQPDEMLYSVTVDEGGAERTRRFVEGDLPEAVRILVEWVDARPESEHHVERPG